MIKLNKDGSIQSYPPRTSEKNLMILNYALKSVSVVLNQEKYIDKWVSWETFGKEIESHYNSEKAKEIVRIINEEITEVQPSELYHVCPL